jgi:hypothetical protein
MHGGRSTGARTPEGLARLRTANHVHGRYSAEHRTVVRTLLTARRRGAVTCSAVSLLDWLAPPWAERLQAHPPELRVPEAPAKLLTRTEDAAIRRAEADSLRPWREAIGDARSRRRQVWAERRAARGGRVRKRVRRSRSQPEPAATSVEAALQALLARLRCLGVPIPEPTPHAPDGGACAGQTDGVTHHGKKAGPGTIVPTPHAPERGAFAGQPDGGRHHGKQAGTSRVVPTPRAPDRGAVHRQTPGASHNGKKPGVDPILATPHAPDRGAVHGHTPGASHDGRHKAGISPALATPHAPDRDTLAGSRPTVGIEGKPRHDTDPSEPAPHAPVDGTDDRNDSASARLARWFAGDLGTSAAGIAALVAAPPAPVRRKTSSRHDLLGSTDRSTIALVIEAVGGLPTFARAVATAEPLPVGYFAAALRSSSQRSSNR